MANYHSYPRSTRVLARPEHRPPAKRLADSTEWMLQADAADLLGVRSSAVTNRRRWGVLDGFTGDGTALGSEEKWNPRDVYYYRPDVEALASVNKGRLSVSEAAEILGVTTALVSELKQAGVLPSWSATTGEAGGNMYELKDVLRFAQHWAVLECSERLDRIRREA